MCANSLFAKQKTGSAMLTRLFPTTGGLVLLSLLLILEPLAAQRSVSLE